MRSVLEFLNETDKLIKDDAIQRSPYASTAVTRLKTYRMKLKELFDKSPDVDSDIVNLVKLADFIHKYYIRSEFYVWDLDKEDKVMLALARDYVEERTYGNSGVSNSSANDGNVLPD